MLPISELFDMAASPVRKLLNTYNFENREIIDLETTTSTTTKRQTEQPGSYFEGGAVGTSQKRNNKDSRYSKIIRNFELYREDSPTSLRAVLGIKDLFKKNLHTAIGISRPLFRLNS